MSENTTRTVRVRASELEGRAWLNTGDKTSPWLTYAAKSSSSTSGPSAASTACIVLDELRPSKKNSPTCSSPSVCTAPNLSTKPTRSARRSRRPLPHHPPRTR